MSRRKSPKPNIHEHVVATAIDEKIQFDEFKALLPSVRLAIKQGKSAKEIYKMGEALAAARALTIAATSTNNAEALAAIKEVLDRGSGKATEHKEVTFTNLSDAELEASLKSTEDVAAELMNERKTSH